MKTVSRQIDTTEQLMHLAQAFHREGYTLYAVGGWVRDHLLGRTPGDLDVASKASPDQVKAMFDLDDRVMIMPRSLPMGTLIIRVDHTMEVEYTCFRSEAYKRDGSHCPEVVTYPVSLEEDALRRDFTVNALYYDILDSSVMDTVGGLSDLEHNRLRAVRAPREVFIEDALRILRLCRQAADLDAEVEADTLEGAKDMAHLMVNLSNERIGAEVHKLLMTKGNLQRGLELMATLGTDDTLGHPLTTESILRCTKAPRHSVLRFAALLWEHNPRETMALARRLCLGAELVADIGFILSHRSLEQEDMPWFMVQCGFKRMGMLLDFHAHVLGADVIGHRKLLAQMVAGGAVDRAEDLDIDGKAIMEALGIAPSQEIGKVKRALLYHVAHHPEDNRRDRLLTLVQNGQLPQIS